MLEWLSAFPTTSERFARSPIRQHLTEYLAHLTEQRYPPKTMRKQADYLVCFGEFLARRERLKAAQFCESVEPFLRELASRPRSAPKVKHILNPITPVLYALGRLPKSTFKPFIFAKEQVASILDAARRLPGNPQFPLRAETCSIIIALLYSLGLRMGEACRLRVGDLSLSGATLFIDQTKFYKSRYVEAIGKSSAKSNGGVYTWSSVRHANH
jgi:integrase